MIGNRVERIAAAQAAEAQRQQAEAQSAAQLKAMQDAIKYDPNAAAY